MWEDRDLVNNGSDKSRDSFSGYFTRKSGEENEKDKKETARKRFRPLKKP